MRVTNEKPRTACSNNHDKAWAAFFPTHVRISKGGTQHVVYGQPGTAQRVAPCPENMISLHLGPHLISVLKSQTRETNQLIYGISGFRRYSKAPFLLSLAQPFSHASKTGETYKPTLQSDCACMKEKQAISDHRTDESANATSLAFFRESHLYTCGEHKKILRSGPGRGEVGLKINVVMMIK